MDEPLRIDIGFLCENCYDAIEDGLAPEQDFRVPVGSKKHLCRRCSATEVTGLCPGGCSLWDCGRPIGHSGPCQAKDDDACACSHGRLRHYWTKREREKVHLCRDCVKCQGYEKPNPEAGFTVEEINSRWAFDDKTRRINERASELLQPLNWALQQINRP